MTGPDLREARERLHMTQEQLAQALGTTRETISRLEGAERLPRNARMVKLAVLGLQVERALAKGEK